MRRSAAVLIVFSCVVVSLSAPAKNAISNNEEGWQQLKKENYQRAVFYFRDAVRQNPRYRDALLGLGKAYLELEAFEHAYDMFGKVLKIDARSVEAVVGTGKALAGMGNHAEALAEFEKARKMSEDNLEAKFGTAWIYYRMGKKIWAVRALTSILRVDPYNLDALLLMAEIKSGEKRTPEAKAFIEKALGAHHESARPHITYGEILFRDYLRTDDPDLLEEARLCLRNALALQPESYDGNRIMGHLALADKKYAEAADYFTKALGSIENGAIRYSIAVANERAGQNDRALDEYLRAYREAPSDSIIRGRMEDFMVFNDYKFGNPTRQSLNEDEYALARDREKKNLADQAIMYLRRALLLNPMNVEAREKLIEYYGAKGLDQFAIDELKELQRLFPDGKYRDRLTVAVIKRRDELHHREGMASDDIPRDVPGVFVAAFDPGDAVPLHAEAGDVIASSLSFVLGQFGRMSPVGIRPRRAVNCGLRCSGEHLQGTMEEVEKLVKDGKFPKVDYLVYGSFRESSNYIQLECKLMDFKKGFIIGEFILSETGKESLQSLSLRAASKIYEMIPFRGRVLKMKENGILVNLGLFDGIDAGEKLVIQKFDRSLIGKEKPRKKIILKVKEADTTVCYAEPLRESDINTIDTTDFVLPAKKKRSRMIR